MKRSLIVIALMAVVGGLAPLVAASNTVTIYTMSGPEITTPILDAFRAAHPNVSINLVKMGTGEIVARLEAEKGNPAADILWGGDNIAVYEANPQLFAPYESVEDKNMSVIDPAHRWHAFTIFCQAIVVNTKVVKQADYPKNVKDLLDPRWKKAGGVALADPTKSGTGYTIVSGLANAFGWSFIEKLVQNSVVCPGSDAMFKAVKDGELPIGFINEDLGATWKAQGQPIEVIYAKDAVTVQLDACGLVKGGPDPEFAKMVLDFLCSKEAHTIAVRTINRRSARVDVVPPANLPGFNDLKLFTAAEPRQVVNAKFSKIYNK
jgi:iron(III) transport system substrate-binding protein